MGSWSFQGQPRPADVVDALPSFASEARASWKLGGLLRLELALLRLIGGTAGQVRSMARWEAALIVAIGLGLGLLIAAAALVPLSHALTGNLRPSVAPGQLAAILGVSALLAVLALALPTRRALRMRPVEAIGAGE
jgi:putative ABC transport system permease protein